MSGLGDPRPCRESDVCKAAICMVELTGTRAVHPVDPEPQWPAMPGMVVVNPESGRGTVVRGDDVALGRTAKWLRQGASFHRSHFATCKAAARVRAHNPGQEKMDV